MRLITKLFAFSIFVGSLISTGANAIEGNTADNGWDLEGQLVVITASPGSIVQYCGVTLMEYSAEIIKPSGMGFGYINIAFSPESNVQTGMHFKVVSQDDCDVDTSRLIIGLQQIDMMD
jgi:hypothetical protein